MKNRELGLPSTNGLHADRHPIMTRAEPHGNTRQAGHVHGRILQLTVSRCCKTHRSRSTRCAGIRRPFAGHWRTTIASAFAARCLLNSTTYLTK